MSSDIAEVAERLSPYDESSASEASLHSKSSKRHGRGARRSPSRDGGWAPAVSIVREASQFSIYIPGVGYVVDTVDGIPQVVPDPEEPEPAAVMAPASLARPHAPPGVRTDHRRNNSVGTGLDELAKQGIQKKPTHLRQHSVDSRVSFGSLDVDGSLLTKGKRRKRRDRQRQTRSGSVNNSETGSWVSNMSDYSTMSELIDETSYGSSSPTLSYSSPSSTNPSSVNHSRANSQSAANLQQMRSSLHPEILSGLLSMAAW